MSIETDNLLGKTTTNKQTKRKKEPNKLQNS